MFEKWDNELVRRTVFSNWTFFSRTVDTDNSVEIPKGRNVAAGG